MKEYIMLEFEDGTKCAIIDKFEYNNKNYFLVSKVLNDKKISEVFNICIYNEKNNILENIEDEEEYNLIKTIFDKKIENQRIMDENLSKINFEEMEKLKITSINNFEYVLQKQNGEIITKNIEFYVKNKPEVNEYIYMSKDIVKEINIFQYGIINNMEKINEKEIIQVITSKGKYYLQRYYG